jgi:lipid-A-disaccharide synthase-like uncharacterized protein
VQSFEATDVWSRMCVLCVQFRYVSYGMQWLFIIEITKYHYWTLPSCNSFLIFGTRFVIIVSLFSRAIYEIGIMCVWFLFPTVVRTIFTSSIRRQEGVDCAVYLHYSLLLYGTLQSYCRAFVKRPSSFENTQTFLTRYLQKNLITTLL